MPVDIAEEQARACAVEMSNMISPTLHNALAGVAEYGSGSEDDEMPGLVSEEESEEESEDEDEPRPLPLPKPSAEHFPESHLRLFCEKEMHRHVLASVATA